MGFEYLMGILLGSDVVVENFDHLEEVLDNLQAFFDTLKGSTFYPHVGSVSQSR